jgi:hypothetical protein
MYAEIKALFPGWVEDEAKECYMVKISNCYEEYWETLISIPVDKKEEILRVILKHMKNITEEDLLFEYNCRNYPDV